MNEQEKLRNIEDNFVFETPKLKNGDILRNTEDFSTIKQCNQEAKEYSESIDNEMDKNSMCVINTTIEIIAKQSMVYALINKQYIDLEKWGMTKNEVQHLLIDKETR